MYSLPWKSRDLPTPYELKKGLLQEKAYMILQDVFTAVKWTENAKSRKNNRAFPLLIRLCYCKSGKCSCQNLFLQQSKFF